MREDEPLHPSRTFGCDAWDMRKAAKGEDCAVDTSITRSLIRAWPSRYPKLHDFNSRRVKAKPQERSESPEATGKQLRFATGHCSAAYRAGSDLCGSVFLE